MKEGRNRIRNDEEGEEGGGKNYKEMHTEYVARGEN